MTVIILWYCEPLLRVWWDLVLKGVKCPTMVGKESEDGRKVVQYLRQERSCEAGACPGRCALWKSFAIEGLSSLSHETLWPYADKIWSWIASE